MSHRPDGHHSCCGDTGWGPERQHRSTHEPPTLLLQKIVPPPPPPFISCGKFGSFYMGKATAAARAALPIPVSVYSVFVCPDSV